MIALARALPAIRPIKPSTNGAGLLAQHKFLIKSVPRDSTLALLAYLWKARFLPLIIGIDENGDVYIYIGGAHAAHMDAKGHSGLLATLGRGAMINV